LIKSSLETSNTNADESSSKDNEDRTKSIMPLSKSILFDQEDFRTQSFQNSFVIHGNCFPLRDGFQLSRVPRENRQIISSILIFNCALVLHVQGYRLNSRAHMKKAVALYQKCHVLLDFLLSHVRSLRP